MCHALIIPTIQQLHKLNRVKEDFLAVEMSPKLWYTTVYMDIPHSIPLNLRPQLLYVQKLQDHTGQNLYFMFFTQVK